jgi:hypothetical protein
MPALEGRGVADIKMPHEFKKIFFRSLHDHMKVVAPDNLGVDPDLVNLDRGF